MPAPATVDEFLDLVQKSGVAEPARLGPYVQALRDGGKLPAEPGKLAGILVRDALLTYFQAEQLLQGKWKRFFIGKYKVLEKIGTGGMGQVFLCEHKLMRRRVAVKVLPTAKAADSSSLQRFYREARAVAALDHPNIVRAYDIDQDEGLHFLVMEFVDGTNLQDLVRKFGPLDVLRACHYVYGSAVGLQYAYEMGIIHRDIKPANILVDRSGVVKILDMGLARFFNDAEDNLTKKYDENVLGTADYLAPEQAMDSSAVDIRADIYSLGGTFYYLLTGLPPFPDGSVAQKLLWHQTREPKTVRAIRPEIPEDLAAILARMMAKEANDRYPTPGDLMAALAPWVTTPIPPPPERELPQFSPAATGATRPAVSGVAMPGVGTDRASRGIVPPSHDTSSVPLPTAVAGPLAPTPGTAATPGAVWENLAAETRANAGSDTGSSARRVTRRKPAEPAAGGTRRVRVILIAAAGVGLLLALAGGGYALYRAFAPVPPPPPRPATAAGVRTWYVTRAGDGGDPEHTVPGLLAAVQKAGPGDTIVIRDDQIEDEPIQIDAKMRLRDVTIEAGNGARSVRWVPGGTGEAAAALKIIGQEGLRVRGLVIDAPGRFDYGVFVTGHVPGLLVEDVTVRGPRVAGFRLNLTADAARPAVLNRVRVAVDSPDAVGVLFAGDARLVTRSARLTASRIDGPPQGGAGVRFAGPAADVEVWHNRISSVDAGVVFAEPISDKTAVRVRIAGNTFRAVRDAGIRCDLVLPPNPPPDIVIADNYFLGTAALAKAPDGKLPGLKAETNARDQASKEGNVPLAAIETPPTGLDQNPAGDSYLRYGKDSPLNSVGPNKVPVGVPPQ